MTMKVKSIPIKSVRIPMGRREIDPELVDALSVSIQKFGLFHPIGIRKRRDGNYFLVHGGHRLAAMKLLKRDNIEARILRGDIPEVMTGLENVLRKDVPLLEKYKTLSLYIKDTEVTRKPAKNIQPHDRGISRTAKALKLHPRVVRAALGVEGLSKFVREKLEQSAHANNASMIDKIVDAKTVGEQLAEDHHIRRRARRVEVGRTGVMPPALPARRS